MKKTILILTLVGLLTAGLQAGDKVQPGQEVLMLIQQDLEPQIDHLDFNEGLSAFLRDLPATMPVRIYAFRGDRIFRLLMGPAGSLKWPPHGFEFSSPSPNPTPYQDLLFFLQKLKVENQRVFFLTNGHSKQLDAYVSREGFLQGASVYTPEAYPVLPRLAKFCRAKKIHLVGIYSSGYIPMRGRDSIAFDDASEESEPITQETLRAGTAASDDDVHINFSSFRYVVETSGGVAFFNFTSYRSLFKRLIKEEIF